MIITAQITGIEYTPLMIKKLKVFDFKQFDVNKLPSSCIIKHKNFTFGLSKWVSPKRTRSYPYARVYDTLGTSKRITIIPIVKDEGINGDRDFIQWDTISLMSLLDVFVILAYYKSAEKHKTKPNKITNQKFDNKYIKQKIIEIQNFHSSALHWNLNEVKEENLTKLVEKVKTSYSNISKVLNVKMHNDKTYDKLKTQLIKGAEEFMHNSRIKAKKAQIRELKTTQPKEKLSNLPKAALTITNYLGGKYFLTVDEVKIKNNKVLLIEAKHSKNNIIPSTSDIKDALIKMILYTNLKDVKINNKKYAHKAILKLTSHYDIDKIHKSKEKLLKKLLKEAKKNNFEIELKTIKK